MKVGIIGLGQMGSGMARSLLAAGHDVTVYNRTRAKAEAVVGQGARLAVTIADACRGDAVITMLADDAAVESAVVGDGGILRHLGPRAIHVSASTISIALADRLTVAHADAGRRFLAAPVFGRPDAAAAGTLFVVAAGAAADMKTCEPLFAAIGQRTFVVSEQPKQANLVKLSGNFLIASVLEALGEAMALVRKGGIEPRAYLEILTSTLFSAPVYKNYGAIIAEQRFQPAGFAAPLGAKDIRIALAAAEALRVPMPLASLLHDRFLTLLATGGEDLDWSAIAMLAARDAGL